jgi:hypothetical protein
MSIDGVSFNFFFCFLFWVVSFQHFVKNIKNTTNHHHNFAKFWLNILYGGLSLEQQHHKLKLKNKIK